MLLYYLCMLCVMSLFLCVFSLFVHTLLYMYLFSVSLFLLSSAVSSSTREADKSSFIYLF